MVSAGIVPADLVGEEFSQLRMKRAHRFIIMKVSDDKTTIEIENIGARTATFEEFKELMPKDACR